MMSNAITTNATSDELLRAIKQSKRRAFDRMVVHFGMMLFAVSVFSVIFAWLLFGKS
jgi:hypothetical protein